MTKGITVSKFGIVFAVILLFFCEWFFFRNVIAADVLISDPCDGRLTMLIAEHWFHVLKGESAITEMGIFYPAKYTLGYSDMLLGIGLTHSAFRFAGLDVFYAYKTTIILWHAVGTASLFYFLWRKQRISVLWAIFGTISFAFSNAYSIYIYHTQLVAMSLIPVFLILAQNCIEKRGNRKLRNIYALLSITFLGLMLYTAWYIAFFLALFFVTAFFVFMILFQRRKPKTIILKTTLTNELKIDLTYCILFGIALIVPFFIIETSAMKVHGGRLYEEVVPYLPEVVDIINVSKSNLLLGGLMQKLGVESRGSATSGIIQGFSIVSLACFAYHLFHGRDNDTDKLEQLILRSIGLSTIIGIILVLKLSSNGVSLWWLVYKIFPGAKSIRSVSRYFLFLSLPMAIYTSFTGNKRLEKQTDQHILGSEVKVSILILALFLTNIHAGGVWAGWNRNQELKRLSEISIPPEDAEVFYLTNAGTEKTDVLYQLDAYQISDYFGVHTINGYSGLLPDGWERIWDIDGDNYLDGVNEWINKHNLRNVYEYNMQNNSWIKRN